VLVGALVVVSLLLFSLYSREDEEGPLHTLQGVAAAVVAPGQQLLNEAVQPLRDLWGWANDLADAKERADRLEAELQQLNSRIVEGQFTAEENARIRALEGIGEQWDRDYREVPAQIYGTSPSPYYLRARLNKGTDDGVVRNSPVIAAGDVRAGLVGIVTQASAGQSVVTFITEPNSGVGVTIGSSDGAKGLLRPSIPGQLKVTGVPREAPVTRGKIVYTSGASQPVALPSPYPRGIPVGVVSDVGRQETDVQYTVQVDPFVDPAGLAYVVVLAPESEAAKRRARDG
jgi:rod shape-determining protein MreC